MATWRYIKGSEKDFKGAPDWALYRDKYEGREYWSEGYESTQRFASVINLKEWRYDSSTGKGEVIAQRERATSVNDGRLARDFGVEQLIAERGSRYGKFSDGAEIIRDLKHVMHEVDGWNNLTASQKEALDMIQHKIGRILNGDPTMTTTGKTLPVTQCSLLNN